MCVDPIEFYRALPHLMHLMHSSRSIGPDTCMWALLTASGPTASSSPRLQLFRPFDDATASFLHAGTTRCRPGGGGGPLGPGLRLSGFTLGVPRKKLIILVLDPLPKDSVQPRLDVALGPASIEILFPLFV